MALNDEIARVFSHLLDGDIDRIARLAFLRHIKGIQLRCWWRHSPRAAATTSTITWLRKQSGRWIDQRGIVPRNVRGSKMFGLSGQMPCCASKRWMRTADRAVIHEKQARDFDRGLPFRGCRNLLFRMTQGISWTRHKHSSSKRRYPSQSARLSNGVSQLCRRTEPGEARYLAGYHARRLALILSAQPCRSIAACWCSRAKRGV